MVAVFGGGWAVPAPAASSVPSDRLDEVPAIATAPLPGETIDADEIPSSNVDAPSPSNLRRDGTAGPSGALNGPGAVSVHSVSR